MTSEELDLKREVVFRPAWDKRSDDPKKNYGVHGVECAFYLRGPLGTIQFVVYTRWMLPQNRHVMADLDVRFNKIGRPDGYDVGYHSPKPMYEGQRPMDSGCQFVEGGKCYYDGSSLRADEWVEVLIAEGSDGIWKLMEQEYKDNFAALAEVNRGE